MISGDNKIPIDKDKLKEEHKVELEALKAAFGKSAFCPSASTEVERYSRNLIFPLL